MLYSDLTATFALAFPIMFQLFLSLYFSKENKQTLIHAYKHTIKQYKLSVRRILEYIIVAGSR
jgi:hypothetical protein